MLTSTPLPAERVAHGAPDAASTRFDHVVFAADRAVRSDHFARAVAIRSAACGRQAGEGDGEDALDAESIQFFTWLCRERGLDVSRYRHNVLKRRLAACLRSVRAGSIAELQAAVARNPEKLDRVLGAVLIGVTSFFRDASVFQALAAELPRLSATSPRLNVLSVACSDGAELYSVAMLLEEQGLLAGSSLRGVDCRADAVVAARGGACSAEAIAWLAPGRLRRHFTHVAGWRVNDALRAACAWDVADAFKLTCPRPVDLLLCRNLAIYLSPDAAAALWARLGGLLRTGGLLVTGKAERPDGPCAWRRIGPCLFQKVETE